MFDDFKVIEPLKPATRYLNDHHQAACGLMDKSGHALPAQSLSITMTRRLSFYLP
jgi:hypothetical protein